MKLKIAAVFAVAFALLLAGCSAPAVNDESVQTQGTYQNVSSETFDAMMDEEHLLLDVRTQEEYDAGHIADAVLIPVDELSDRMSEIEVDQDTPILVYCRSGNRSAVASDLLVNAGFNQVYNLLGGYNGLAEL